MPTDPAQRRLGVRFDERIWGEVMRGFSGHTLDVAVGARQRLEEGGVSLAELLPCESPGPDGTDLAGCAKLYLPAGEGPPSERSFAFVLQLARDDAGNVVFIFIGFGRRHPGAGVRNVYERAHRQLHGRFPSA